jgi:phage tail-like protein
VASVTPKHAVLRDGPRWEGARIRGLEVLSDGSLSLARLAGALPGSEVDLPAPWDVSPSGVASDGRGGTFLADTSGDSVVHLDPVCGTRILVTGLGFDRPRGLVVSGAHLLVADSGHARIQVFRLPTLELEAVWPGFGAPVDLAADGEGRIYVADAGVERLLRLSPRGVPDTAWNAAAAAHPALAAPRFLAVDAAGRLFVSDAAARAVLRLDPEGAPLGGVAALEAEQPGALALHEGMLYLADAASGALRAVRLEDQLDLGPVPGFRGPVTALAGDARALLVKAEARGAVAALPWRAGCIRRGVLVAGPFDAGVGETWERVHVQGQASPPGSLELAVSLGPSPAGPPDARSWQPAAFPDTLVPPPPLNGSTPPASARYLWVRVALASADGRTAPRLAQVEATTTASSYLEELPAVYARQDDTVAGGFLRRWLALFRAGLGDEEQLLETMASRFDPRTTPPGWLDWLADWVAFTVPTGTDPEAARALVEAAHDIHTRRGTRAGLREAVLRETGLRVQVLEAYRERRIWELGVSSRLGFDTALPPVAPGGAVVPDPAAALVVGSYVVGQSGPLEAADFVTPLVEETAHLFTVVLSPGQCVDDELRARLREVLDAEKPAHTDYHLCPVEPRMRVGFQARIGVDSLVAGPSEPMRLENVRLGLDAVLGDADAGDPAGRVGRNARIGRGTVLA